MMSFARVDYRFRYMEWAKTVMESGRAGVIDIGSSGIARVSMRELGLRLSALELFGPHYYGEPEMRRRISRLAHVATRCVLPTLGASHAYFLICASLLEPGDEVIVETPGYEALASVPRILGARVKPLLRRFENGFQFDPSELRRALTSKTRLIVVTNPHNPSGVVLDKPSQVALATCAGGYGTSTRSGEKMGPDRCETGSSARRGGARAESHAHAGLLEGGESLPAHALAHKERASPLVRRRPIQERVSAASATALPYASRDARDAGDPMDPPGVPGGVWVLVNEVYRGLARVERSAAGHTLGPRGISVGSMTKVHGLGETRVGWAIADAGLVHRASRVNDFGVVNGPYIAERVGAFALAHHRQLLDRARAIIGKNRRVLDRFLAETKGLELVPTQGLLFFPRVEGISDTSAFARRALARHKVCVVPGEFFGAPGHIRIGIGAGDPRRLAEGLRRLGAALRSERG